MKVSICVEGVDLDIHLEERGDQGKLLLMVHGIPTNACLWRKVQEQLEGHYRTYALDMVGYGRSSMPLDSFVHTLTNQAKAIKAVIEQLDVVGEVILVAHDHGGGAAQILAANYPEHISRLVLVDVVSFDYWPVLEVEFFNSLVHADDTALEQAMTSAVANFGMLLRCGSYRHNVFTDKVVKRHYLRFWGRGPHMTGFKSLIKIASQPHQGETMGVDHSAIRCPTMVCWGENDAWMPAQAAYELKAAMVNAPVRVQILPECGHYVPEDSPQQLADYIHDFITEWDGIPSAKIL